MKKYMTESILAACLVVLIVGIFAVGPSKSQVVHENVYDAIRYDVSKKLPEGN